MNLFSWEVHEKQYQKADSSQKISKAFSRLQKLNWKFCRETIWYVSSKYLCWNDCTRYKVTSEVLRVKGNEASTSSSENLLCINNLNIDVLKHQILDFLTSHSLLISAWSFKLSLARNGFCFEQKCVYAMLNNMLIQN